MWNVTMATIKTNRKADNSRGHTERRDEFVQNSSSKVEYSHYLVWFVSPDVNGNRRKWLNWR